MNTAAGDAAIYANGKTYAEHCAWLDSLTGHDWMMVNMPIGHLFNLAYVAYFKYALLTIRMTAAMQLKVLDAMAGMVRGPVTAEAVEAIAPACDTAVQMLHELHKVPRSEVTRTFSDADMFRLLAKLNPSLLRALELCTYYPPVPMKKSA
jgi:hypothetical protein